jgi:hypothetical protein
MIMIDNPQSNLTLIGGAQLSRSFLSGFGIFF